MLTNLKFFLNSYLKFEYFLKHKYSLYIQTGCTSTEDPLVFLDTHFCGLKKIRNVWILDFLTNFVYKSIANLYLVGY